MTEVEANQNAETKLGTISLDDFTLDGMVPKKPRSKGFLRSKMVSGHQYWYWCKNVRQPDGHFKQVVIEYLGKTVPRKLRLELKKGRK